MFSVFKLQPILFLTFTLIASLPVFILGYWVQESALENEINAVEEKHLLLAKNVTRDLSRYIIDVDNSFNLVITNVQANNEIDGLVTHLKTLQISTIYFTDESGNINTQIPRPLKQSDNASIDSTIWPLLQQTIKQAKITGKITYSNLLNSRNSEKKFFIIKALDDNKLAIAALSTSYIQEVQKQIAFGRRGHVAIVDRSGRAIAHPVANWVAVMKDMSFLPPVQKMKQGATGVSRFYTPAMKGDVIAGYTVVPETGWGVMVPQPFEELEQHASNIQNTAFIIILVGITVAGLISWFLSGLLVGPIHSVVEATKFLEDENHKFILPAKVATSIRFMPKEIQELIDSFNGMGNRLNSITAQLYSKIDFANNEVQDQNLKLMQQARELKIINEELERLSTTDNLTNLFNRRLFDEMMDNEYAFAQRHTEFLSLVMLDIDRFKSINDDYGHIQGDRVLIEVANILRHNFRASDVVFRIGGEEFAILCRRTNYDDSKKMAENLRFSLEQHKFQFKDDIHCVTASFGLVTIPDEQFEIENTECLYRFADKAMYYSKNHGRNRITHYRDILISRQLVV